MPKKSYKKKHLTSFQLIILGFAGVILLGSVLLMLPFSSVDKIPTPFHEALFTATSAVCVTGLVVKDTGSYWSLAGISPTPFKTIVGRYAYILSVSLVEHPERTSTVDIPLSIPEITSVSILSPTMTASAE